MLKTRHALIQCPFVFPYAFILWEFYPLERDENVTGTSSILTGEHSHVGQPNRYLDASSFAHWDQRQKTSRNLSYSIRTLHIYALCGLQIIPYLLERRMQNSPPLLAYSIGGGEYFRFEPWDKSDFIRAARLYDSVNFAILYRD